jgi:hypothetical protein
MKALHRDDLFGWSLFDESRNIDFHSVFWQRPEGNVVIDPLPLSDHDARHVDSLGGVRHIVVTNSDHLRAAPQLKARYDAELCGPTEERSSFAVVCDRWLQDGDLVVPGLVARALSGSKTPGELCLVLRGDTLITGDLIRGQRGGCLNLLPDAKLSDPAAARRSVRHLVRSLKVECVLVGDGWHVFHAGQRALDALLAGFLPDS